MAKRTFTADERVDALIEQSKFIDYQIAKIKFIKSKFPKVKIKIKPNQKDEHCYNFFSKLVNENYNGYEFDENYSSLNINFFHEIKFSYDDFEDDIIKIQSIPESYQIAFVRDDYFKLSKGDDKSSKIIFLEFPFNKDEKLIKDCKLEIIKFIQKFPNAELDTTNLNPSIKKLLTFI